ncbi:MAG: di-trans,poly-cis-decaprenylcistransferase [Chromatiales bacterium]|jgi:undecaprenyl diphosphate synthase|nr:MAG: di-trans,poly-cis-decaprenylcistransferase [Chromatiales bacterium]
MDGNGRWANSKGKPRRAGHRAGVKAVRTSIETAAQRGIEFLTLFAFSSENWSRPEEEVSSLMNLFVEALRREVDELHRNNVKLKFVGALNELATGLKNKIALAEDKTANNTGLSLTVAMAYGGRWDIIEATKAIAARVAEGALRIDDINDAEFAAQLELSGLPDPDLLIRTGGEQRISNFLLWNLAYSELWFTDVLWPEFDAAIFDQALSYYSGKQRRFGHTGDQVESV